MSIDNVNWKNIMTTLIVGASGATGRLLVNQLLDQGERVKIIVRPGSNLLESLKQNDQLLITEANLLDMTDSELLKQTEGCRAVVSCLGHNLTFKGMFCHPRLLVLEGVQRLCRAIENSSTEKVKTNPPIKFILMNTTGNQNAQAGETVSIAETLVIGLIRYLIPPHADNELAAAYLQSNVGSSNKRIEWVAVRPDSLINEKASTEYDIYSSPQRSAIFNAGKTSRINVAHFMAQLISNDSTWDKWNYQMPVIYNTHINE